MINAVSRYYWGDGSNFVGIIDEVAIFDVALVADEILDIATNVLMSILDTGASVQPADKLASTWGELKK